jgi:hypothetical protein
MSSKEKVNTGDKVTPLRQPARPRSSELTLLEHGRVPDPVVVRKARSAPHLLSARNVLQLQRTVGNRAVGRILGSVQRQQASLDELVEENNTGLPDHLQAGVENLSGMSIDDVQVHYNSSKPATLQALAYTQGTDVHVAPGQESCLAHEAWHVVQQKQGRVQPTMRADGVEINDDPSLEQEADMMGTKALQMQEASGKKACASFASTAKHFSAQGSPIQRKILKESGFIKKYHLAEMRARGDETSGYTPPSVNDTKCDPADDSSWVYDELNKPTVSVKQIGEEKYVAQVDTVPTNHAGYLMYLPKEGPWKARANKERIFSQYWIPPYSGDGEVTLEVTGNPDAHALEGQVKRHEDVHAKDIMKAIKRILISWDKRLTKAMKKKIGYQETTAEKAEAKLWKAMGGTPQQIGAQLHKQWEDDSDAFHKTAKGKSPPAKTQKVNENYVRLIVQLPI